MTSFGLKRIAILAMTIDHAAKIIGQSGLMTIFPDMSLRTSSEILHLMEGIGRIAFPLFAFMIAEGASKTRSMPRYIGQLALFAILSEPAFYFAFNRINPTMGGLLNSLSRLNLTNVFFTLTLGAVAIYAYQLLQCKIPDKARFVFVPVFLLVLFIGAYIGCDYSMEGVFLIVALFLVKKKAHKIIIICLWSLWLYVISYVFYSAGIVWSYVFNCICASLSGVLIWNYNGKRGKPLKWIFYLYYPAHLLLLICIRTAIF